jgi:hypothetical protein
MNARGFCLDCNKEKVVAVTGYANGPTGPNIPIGRCFDCRNAANVRRREAGELVIFVPASPEVRAVVRPGSAIVGRRDDNGQVLIYFEGNVYGYMTDFDEMLLHAADRLVSRYPTVARAVVGASELAEVGYYDYGAFSAEITDQPALDAWRAT